MAAGSGEKDPERSQSAAYRRERKTRRLLTERRRHQFTLAGVIGLLSGLLAVLFQWAIYWAESLRGMLVDWLAASPVPAWLVLPVVCGLLGLAAGALLKLAPEASGSGIPHVKAVLLRLKPFRWMRVILVKLSGGLAAMAAGLSLGREGPTVQMGAAVGEGVAKYLKASRKSESQLISAGAGSGLAAAFNAPLSGFIFVIEELQRELSPLTYGTALIASVVGNIVARLLTGQIPSFTIESHPTPSLWALPVAVVIGVAGAGVGVLWNKGIIASSTWFRRLPSISQMWKVAAVAAVAGLVVVLMPLAAGSGHHTAQDILRGEFNGLQWMPFLFWLLVVKFGLSLLSYGSGAPGGIFAPMLVVGAIVGQLCGQGAASLFPSLGLEPQAVAILGMAALFAASVRAPLTAVVLIMEMTANFEILLFLLLASFTAALLAERWRGKPIYEELLAADLKRDKPDDTPEPGEPMLEDWVVEHGSPLEGTLLKDAGFPPGCLVVTIKRHGEEMVPSGQAVFQRGDEVTLVISGAAHRQMHSIHERFMSEH